MQNLSSTHLPPNAEVLAKLAELGTAPIRSGMSLLDLLRRSEMTYEKLQQAFEVPELPEVVAEQVEILPSMKVTSISKNRKWKKH